MERKPEDIRLYAKLGHLIYIDGYTAQIISMKPSKNQHGDDVWEFLLNPSDELIKRYNIQPNSKGDMIYTQKIIYEMVVQLNADPSWTRWLCLFKYDGDDSFTTRLLKGSYQQKVILELKQELRREKWLRENAVENLKMIQNNLPKYLQKNFTPMLEQFSPVLDKIFHKDTMKSLGT